MRSERAGGYCARSAGVAFAVAVLATLDLRPVAQPKEATSIPPPLSFEANGGQTDPRVKFLSRGNGYTLFLTPGEAVLAVQRAAPLRPGERGSKPGTLCAQAVLRMRLVGADPDPEVTGLAEQPGRSHYLVGKDPRRWRTGIPHYARVAYREVYPGIDMVFHGDPGRLEYDFLVSPGADLGKIRMGFEGTGDLRLDTNGSLILPLVGGDVVQPAPIVYQEIAGRLRPLKGAYRLLGEREVGFAVASHDETKRLVIDPVLSYSTYLGGSGNDEGFGIAVDAAGSAYVTGWAESADFPTVNPAQPQLRGAGDAFVAKLSPDGSGLIYSTYLGGSAYDAGYSIAVDVDGDAYVAGTTGSTDFPTVNALQPAFGGGSSDAFVAKLSPSGSDLLYSTYLGGSGAEGSGGIAVDAMGQAYLAGSTSSADFPTVNPAQPTKGGPPDLFDAYVAKLDPSGSALVYSTYLGGSADDGASGIVADAAGDAFVLGATGSTDFPTLNALQPARAGRNDAFVASFDPTGAIRYSTYLGGSRDEEASGISVDTSGSAYVTGGTTSTDFPTADPFQVMTGNTGVYKSTDGGRSWRSGHFNNGGPSVLAIDPSVTTTLYAGTSQKGVFKSTDGATSWFAVNNGLTNPSVHALAVDPQAHSTVYAGTGPLGGLFKSTDGGGSWTTLGPSKPYDWVFALMFGPLGVVDLLPNTLYAGIPNSVARSTNGGTDWTYGSVGTGREAVWVAVDPHNPLTAYAATRDRFTPSGGGIFKSTNGGVSWSRSSAGIVDSYGRYLDASAVVVDPLDSLTVYAAIPGLGVYKSADGGATWGPRNTGLGNLSVFVLALDSAIPPALYAGTFGGGVFKSTTGGESWTVANAGLGGLAVFALATDPSNASTLYAGVGAGDHDAFIAKLSPDGSSLVYSSYLGGGGNEQALSVAVDGQGDASVTGWTNSLDFPTSQALQPEFGGGYADAFVAKFDPSGSALIYSTFLGGRGNDLGWGIAVDANGNVFVSGDTDSADFPTANALQPVIRGSWDSDVFVTKIDPSPSP